jgi:hypothetical protein
MIHPDVAERLNKARALNKRKKSVEGAFRRAKGREKIFFSQLYLKLKKTFADAGEKPPAIAELERLVYASEEWIAFADALADAETEFNWIKLELDIQRDGVIGEMSGAKYSRFEEGA